MSKEELLKYLIAEIDLIMHDKDYRFENANGTWYSRESCRDLTNEEVFEELRTELRQLADLEAKLAERTEQLKIALKDFNDIQKENDKLAQQLAEKDELLKQKIGDMKSTDFIKMCISCGFMVEAKENDNQTAIRELKKLKEIAYQSATDISLLLDYTELVKIIDNQINELKGEQK